MGRLQVMPLRERPNPLAQDRPLRHRLLMEKRQEDVARLLRNGSSLWRMFLCEPQ